MSNEATNSAAARLGWLNRAFHTLVGEALHRSIAWFISSNYEFNGISLVKVSLYRLPLDGIRTMHFIFLFFNNYIKYFKPVYARCCGHCTDPSLSVYNATVRTYALGVAGHARVNVLRETLHKKVAGLGLRLARLFFRSLHQISA